MGADGELAGAALRYKQMHLFYLRVWFICASVVVIMASWMAYVGASPDKYDDIQTQWQACLFQPNYFYSPLMSPVKLGMFVNALVFVGMIGVGMTLMGNCAMYFAWGNTKFSVAAAFFGLWCSLVGFTYYTPSPPLPIPSETNATLFILMYWIKKDYFSDLSNDCRDTYNFVVVYIAVCFIMLFVMGMGTNMTFYYLYQKYKALNVSILGELRNAPSKYPSLIFGNTLLMMIMYIGAFIGKVVSSTTAVDAYADGLHSPTLGRAVYPEIFFPFKPAYMSISSMCWAAIFVGVLYGLTNKRENVSSFKLAAAAALLYVLVSYPSMVYIIQMYYQMDLDSDKVCTSYFNSGNFICCLVLLYFIYR